MFLASFEEALNVAGTIYLRVQFSVVYNTVENQINTHKICVAITISVNASVHESSFCVTELNCYDQVTQKSL